MANNAARKWFSALWTYTFTKTPLENQKHDNKDANIVNKIQCCTEAMFSINLKTAQCDNITNIGSVTLKNTADEA